MKALKKSSSKSNISKIFHLEGARSGLDIDKKIREGFPVSYLTKFSQYMGLRQEDLAKVMGITSRTLQRQTSASKVIRHKISRLSFVNSDRLYRLARIYEFAIQVLGDKEYTKEWFLTPKKYLDGNIPFMLLKSEAGVKEVENLLGRIEHGVYG